ncbi:MAG: hypothetical protein HOJ95_05165 [Nitrospinaceae bacterium]|nr:hypothetical protein [Nitrospinaceae bacterium]MBT3433359.1 hypothetical protein [Nitrospinaceae bacterium]MBT3820297.1 hypothetical protein [Nitrospinaceae bacterium]MBT4092794.1 hypothetical protein [Nitrospinaceae bacterium]MBT5367347.1 hypothetical protein [Nitrospinaceae bacterium]
MLPSRPISPGEKTWSPLVGGARLLSFVHIHHLPLFFSGKGQMPIEKIGQFEVRRLGALENNSIIS